MAQMTLDELSEKMKDIDFCMMFTKSLTGGLAGRPMSNNGDVEYEGDSYFFTDEDTAKVDDIKSDAHVSLSFTGQKGLLGKPPIFIAVDGTAELIRDKTAFEEHWTKDLDRWFADGIDTSGLLMIKTRASQIRYWDGEEEGRITV